MYEVTVTSFLGHLYNDLVAECNHIREISEVLKGAVKKSQGKDNPSNLRMAVEVVFLSNLNRKYLTLEILEDEKNAIEDILNNRAGSKVERLVSLYLERIKERYELDPEKDRIAVRILKAEIGRIENELEQEGFPLLGGCACYESMMEEADEQMEFDFSNPDDEGKE